MFQRMSQWLTVKLIQPAKTLHPDDIGLAAAVGLYGGVFPVPAVSTGATLAMCYGPLRSRYRNSSSSNNNSAAMMSITLVLNLIATPFQLLLMPKFLNAPYNFVNNPQVKEKIKAYFPDWVSSKADSIQSCNVSDFVGAIETKPVSEVLIKFGSSIIWASVAWALMAPIAILSSRFVFSRVITAFKKHRPPAKPPFA